MKRYSLEKFLQNTPNECKPIPFWSWNDKLDLDETRSQIKEMENGGMGGYFMHARGGLETEYLCDDWMQNINEGINEGKARNMSAWGYDENGWPSGFGNGIINGMGELYQQKYLRCELFTASNQNENTICTQKIDDIEYRFYYELNPLYVDTLNKKVTQIFCQKIHSKYKSCLKDNFKHMAGFFTDEPQISRNGIPWSLTIPAEYKKKYNEDIESCLGDLFFETNTHNQTRVRFYSLIRDLFAEGYVRTIYDWCQQNSIKLAGHVANEDSPLIQLTSNGACMSMYEYFHIPGMDALTRNLVPSLIPMQLSSVCHQLEKKQVLSEAFALSGWNVSMEDMRWMLEHQMVRGVTLLCTHLAAYSLRGIRKRDYPASIFYQQPWWNKFSLFSSMISRIGSMLQEGEICCNVLLYHPQSSVWTQFNNADNGTASIIEEHLEDTMLHLEKSQIPYHLCDERIFQRYGSTNDNFIRIGSQKYSTVILPGINNISKPFFKAIIKFVKNAGTLLVAWQAPTLLDGCESKELNDFFHNMPVLSSHFLHKTIEKTLSKDCSPLQLRSPQALDDVASTQRYFDDFTLHYIVNSSNKDKVITTCITGNSVEQLDAENGKLKALSFKLINSKVYTKITILAKSSALLIANNCHHQQNPAIEKASPLPLSCGEWNIETPQSNTLTLDVCDYFFDDKLQGKGIPINNIQEIACSFKKPVNIKLQFKFCVEEALSAPIYLLMENPEKFEITLNNIKVNSTSSGWFCDKSFKKIDITKAVHIGENLIELVTVFRQCENVLTQIENAKLYESEKNKLTYDDEIEAIYIVGSFAVSAQGKWQILDKNAERFSGTFSLATLPKTFSSSHLHRQGFPFFAGKLRLTRKIYLNANEVNNRCIKFHSLPSVGAEVFINGKSAGNVLWAPYEVTCGNLLQEGLNVIEIELFVSLRNMLGPHHLQEGECHVVVPGSFFQASELWCNGNNENWNYDYCFVDISLNIQ